MSVDYSMQLYDIYNSICASFPDAYTEFKDICIFGFVASCVATYMIATKIRLFSKL